MRWEPLAYLSGGPRRVAETAVASLVEAGGVRISREGVVRRIGRPRPTSPVESAVVALTPRPLGALVRLTAASVWEVLGLSPAAAASTRRVVPQNSRGYAGDATVEVSSTTRYEGYGDGGTW